MTLVLVSAYAGWAGSLPAHEAERRLQQALTLSGLSPAEFVDALLPTMFCASTPLDVVAEFGATMREFHPDGFRCIARAAAEDLRDVLASVEIPTLLVYGDRDERAPMEVAERLRASIPTSSLVVLRGAGHLCNVEAPEEFNRELRAFLRSPPQR